MCIDGLKVHPCSQHLEKATMGCLFLGMLWAGIFPLLHVVAPGLGAEISAQLQMAKDIFLCSTYVTTCFEMKSITVPWEGGLYMHFPSAGSRVEWWQC